MSEIVDDDAVECIWCAASYPADMMLTTTGGGDSACTDCARTCERCGDVGDSDDYRWIDSNDELWCNSCADDYASWCDYCERTHSGSTYYASDSNANYCEDCIHNLNYCEDCDEYYVEGCDSHNDSYSQVIHDYSYRPDPIFHSTDKEERLFFGIEIEVEAPNNRAESAEYANRLEDMELAYLKNDGSLQCGFEIVTHPMTHDFYKNEADELWKTIENLRSSYGVKSWGTRTCGLHIHISRTGFKNPPHMHRFLNLIYSNESFYSALAGRSASRWAKFDDVIDGKYVADEQGDHSWHSYRSFRKKIDDNRNSDRYSAVNTQNHATLEMRIFKGSLKPSNVKSQLDLAHASVEYTRNMTIQEVKGGSLSTDSFVEYIFANADLYPDLCERVSRLNPSVIPTTI
jgi:hypothetical protein